MGRVGAGAAGRAELEVDGLILRHRIVKSADGLSAREGTFLACTFWLAECLAHQGHVEEARAAFERAYGSANDLGLLAEEYDPKTHELLGNFPQGLTHLAHISAAVALTALLVPGKERNVAGGDSEVATD